MELEWMFQFCPEMFHQACPGAEWKFSEGVEKKSFNFQILWTTIRAAVGHKSSFEYHEQCTSSLLLDQVLLLDCQPPRSNISLYPLMLTIPFIYPLYPPFITSPYILPTYPLFISSCPHKALALGRGACCKFAHVYIWQGKSWNVNQLHAMGQCWDIVLV